MKDSTPIEECSYQVEDKTCDHPKNMTPECHVWCCPRIPQRVFNEIEKECCN